MKFFPPKTTSIIRLSNILSYGEIVLDTDENKLYIGDGTTLGGIVVGQGLTTSNGLNLNHISTPLDNPSANTLRVYSKSDNNIYTQDSEGNEKQIGGNTNTNINDIFMYGGI